MSRVALVFIVIVLLGTHFIYYPKWKKENTEATISWDVSGYYMYLPATFIYKDLKKCTFKDEIVAKYQPAPDFQQAFIHKESGNYVMKYSMGQAIVFSPFFLVAHIWAKFSSIYPADGFSFPYQFMISMGSLIIAFIGLFYLRKALLTYFSEWAVSLTLVGLVLGSNYLNYSAIDGAMTHNTLFTIYALIIYNTIKFYEKPGIAKALTMGILVGLGALVRPTEILSFLIPLLWGVNLSKKELISDRIHLLLDHRLLIMIAVTACLLIGSLQLFYWHYVSGEWIVYSYEDQGFSWLSPHIYDGLLSYKSGWLTYSPFMIFSLIGFYFLYRKHVHIFFTCLVFASLFIYVAFAWDIWWYGGSLGQRTMVQCYPILAFPLAAFFEKYLSWPSKAKILIGGLILFFVYASLWFTHQAHRGGLLHVAQMNKQYYWKTLLTYENNPENLKLLDSVKKLYEGERENVRIMFIDSTSTISLNQDVQYSPEIVVPMLSSDSNFDWIRVSADFSIGAKEWDFWAMTQFIVELKNKDEVVSHQMFRVQRLMNDNQTKRLYLDIRKPKKLYTDLLIKAWNAQGHKSVDIKNFSVEIFDEK